MQSVCKDSFEEDKVVDSIKMLRAVANAAGSAIINHLEDQGRSNPNSAAGMVSNEVLLKRRRLALEKEVAAKMRTYEMKSIEDNEASVLGLYLHFFWTIPALVECCLWFGLYSAGYATLFVFYYLQACFSCGKGCTKETNEQMGAMMHGVAARWGYYFVTPTFLLGNLIMPWAPPLYFYKRYEKLTYPSGGYSTYRELTRETRENQVPCLCWCCYECTDECMDEEEGCCACGGIEKHKIPSYMSVGRHLLTVGCGSACENIDDGDIVLERVTKTVEADTAKFFMSTYGGDVKNFEELCNAQLGGGAPSNPTVVQGEVLTSNLPSASTAVPVEAHVIASGERSGLTNKA